MTSDTIFFEEMIVLCRARLAGNSSEGVPIAMWDVDMWIFFQKEVVEDRENRTFVASSCVSSGDGWSGPMDPPDALKFAADIWQYPPNANRNTHTHTHTNKTPKTESTSKLVGKVGNHQLHVHTQNKTKQNQLNKLLIAYFKYQTKLRNEIHWIERLAVAKLGAKFIFI